METSTPSANSRLIRGARRRRLLFMCTVFGAGIVYMVASYEQVRAPDDAQISAVQGVQSGASELASITLETIAIKGRAPSNNYDRSNFGAGWASVAGCDTRNRILERDLEDVVVREDGCVVVSGKLNDPYTAKQILFTRGDGTSNAVQIDHVVALSDAWQKGAANLGMDTREQFANDPLNLLAVDGPTNVKKSDSDAASWLPPNKSFRCRYVARQISVKSKYGLWVTRAEHDVMERVLNTCPGQVLPVVVARNAP